VEVRGLGKPRHMLMYIKKEMNRVRDLATRLKYVCNDIKSTNVIKIYRDKFLLPDNENINIIETGDEIIVYRNADPAETEYVENEEDKDSLMNVREKVLKDRENKLDVKEIELKRKEISLKNVEDTLKVKEGSLKSKGKVAREQLNEKEDNLKKREEEIKVKEEGFKKRENDLSHRASELVLKENEVRLKNEELHAKKKEAFLKTVELYEKVKIRNDELNRKETELNMKQVEFDKKVDNSKMKGALKSKGEDSDTEDSKVSSETLELSSSSDNGSGNEAAIESLPKSRKATTLTRVTPRSTMSRFGLFTAKCNTSQRQNNKRLPDAACDELRDCKRRKECDEEPGLNNNVKPPVYHMFNFM